MYSPNILKKRLLFILIIVLIVVAGLIWFLNRPGKVVITSDSGADIFVATEKGGDFKKIGTSTATYSSRNVPNDIYIQVSTNGKKTISGIELERGKTKDLTLRLSPQVAVQQITTGSVSNVFISGLTGQGIVPDDYSLINFRTDNMAADPRPEFIGLPYIKKIVWYDADNFIYNSLNEGVGRFVNGQAVYKDGLASSITGKGFEDTDPTTFIGDLVTLSDIAQPDKKPLVLLSERNIFISNDRGTSIQSIVDFEPDDSVAPDFIFATNDYIYRFAGDDNTAFLERDADTEEYGSTLYQYNYKGEQLATIPIDENTLRSVTSKGSRTYILTNEELISYENNEINNLDLYFNYARDITTYNNRVVMLGDDGLWQIADDGVSLQLLHEFKDSGVGLAQSFSISGNTLIFGTQPSPGDSKSTARMFSTSF